MSCFLSCVEVLGLPIDLIGAADSKPSSQRFLLYRWKDIMQTGHLFKNNEAFGAERSMCALHGKQCSPIQGEVDITVAGLPCKAFSALRDKRGGTPCTGAPSMHPAYSAVEGFTQYLKQRRPSCFIIEEVLAFMHKDSRLKSPTGLPESHLARWSRSVAQQGYSIRVLKWEHSAWMNVRRPRLLIVGVSPRCGGKQGAEWIASALMKVISFRQLQRPVDVWSLVDVDGPEEQMQRERDAAAHRQVHPGPGKKPIADTCLLSLFACLHLECLRCKVGVLSSDVFCLSLRGFVVLKPSEQRQSRWEVSWVGVCGGVVPVKLIP